MDSGSEVNKLGASHANGPRIEIATLSFSYHSIFLGHFGISMECCWEGRDSSDLLVRGSRFSISGIRKLGDRHNLSDLL